MNQFGQINNSTERWKLIQKVIKNNNIKTIVEIGTWKGMGSTLAILESMDQNADFYSLETNFEFFKIAKKNLFEFEGKFKLIYGRIVEINDVIEFSKNLLMTNEQKNWLREDLENMKKSENVILQIPEKIDFLLLDGGEFSTYAEWSILKQRSKIIALDDIRTFKCKKIFEEMNNDNNFELIGQSNEINGFCIFEKIN